MDALVDLLPLLFVGAYYLLSARRKARIRKADRQRAEAPQEALIPDGATTGSASRESTPFQSFLEQLEEAMAEAGGVENDDRPSPREDPRPVEVVPAEPAAVPTEFHTPPGSFDAAQPVDHEAHGFGAANPFSEEAFEKAPAFAPKRAPSGATYDPHGLQPPPRRAGRPAPNWRRRLRDPDAAREAFVLQTLFGPRGGIRGDRRTR